MKRVLLALLAGVVVYAVGIAWSYYAVPEAPVSVHEHAPNGEDASIIRIIEAAVAAVDAEAEADGFRKRDAHAKPHGCVKATFTASEPEDLPLRYRTSVFIPTVEYKAWLRFSNGTQSDDTKPDARGLGIKLMDVAALAESALECWTPETEDPNPHTQALCKARDWSQGISQDFNMINYPVFFLPDVMAYEQFFGFQVEHNPISYFVSWNPFEWKTRELINAAGNLFNQTGSPLDATYFSMTAFKLGRHNAKYSAAPCEERETPIPKDAGPNFLREALDQQVSTSDSCFELRAQLQDPTEYMPIENPMIPWDEEQSPWVTLGKIEIPKQEFNTDAQNQFCEQLSFSPWQGITAHRPLGGLNRVRRLVYDAVSTRRHMRNGVIRHEPRGWCLNLDGKPCPDTDSNAESSR